MSKHGFCAHCSRRYKSAAAREAAERYAALHDALRAETGYIRREIPAGEILISYSTTPKHFEASEAFRTQANMD